MTFELQRVITQLNKLKQDYESVKTAIKNLQNTNIRSRKNEDALAGWIFTEEVKTLLGISTATLYRYIESGILPVSKLGSRLIFKVEDITKILENNYKHYTTSELQHKSSIHDDTFSRNKKNQL